MLEIAGTLVTRSEGGALEAEYTMFDASEIELRATEYGAIREVGYRTTVADALARLDAAGATTAAIRDVTAAVHAVARTYAPETSLPLLGIVNSAELLTADTFDAERHLYASALLDLARLAVDSGVNGAAAAMQAAGLAAWLRDARPDDEVTLRTADYMATRRPGERSIRRVSLSGLRALPPALTRLREQRSLRSTQPTRVATSTTVATLVEWFRKRGASPERVAWAELALASGPGSETGPLSDPRALAIDALFRAGRGREALPLVDRLEVETGRTSAVQYLRLRGALDSEPPNSVAERASALLERDPSAELRVLAARAYNEAGHTSRAIALANEVLSDRNAPAALKDEARKYVEVTAELLSDDDTPQAPRHVSEMPTRIPSRPPPSAAPTAPPPGTMRPSAPELVLDLPKPPPVHVEVASFATPLSKRPTPIPSVVTGVTASDAAPPPSSKRPFIMGITSPPRGVEPMPSSKRPTPPAPPAAPISAAPTSGMPTRPPPPAEIVPSFRPAPPPGTPSTWLRGASQPPFQSMPPGMSIPAAPGVPSFQPRPPELAETLSLPPGLHGQAVPFDAVPKSVAEARVQFTLLSRALGKHYRERRGIALKTDLSGVEAMQTALRERFSVPAIRSADEASDVRSHGAFLSEILARSFGAEWVDIAPTELGYWAMATPNRLRVFPFGRVLRFILQGHRERDLVSYFLEIEARSHSAR